MFHRAATVGRAGFDEHQFGYLALIDARNQDSGGIGRPVQDYRRRNAQGTHQCASAGGVWQATVVEVGFGVIGEGMFGAIGPVADPDIALAAERIPPLIG
ncbi:Uncharacterised protein [Mycobacteroides abscessus subsp. abscessus]|nr:Uncharacterised protein [Mycobacteroides abscessus subsp. abscessus]